VQGALLTSLGKEIPWPRPQTTSTTSKSRNKSHESFEQQVRSVDSTSNTCVKMYLGLQIARTTSRTMWCVWRFLYTAEQDLRRETSSTPSSPTGNFVHFSFQGHVLLGVFWDFLRYPSSSFASTCVFISSSSISRLCIQRDERQCTCTRSREP
jgi:hypothetical protein